MADEKFSVYGKTDPALDDFISSITKRLADSGVEANYLKYADVKDLFNQAVGLQKDIGKNPRLDLPEIAKTRGLDATRNARLTPAEQKTNTTYGKYDSVRDRLKRNFGETTTGVDKAILGKAIDDTLIEMRNKQYEEPAPAAAPAAAPAGESAQKEVRLGAGSALFPDGIKMPETTPMTQEKTPIFSEPKATTPAATPAAPAAGRDMNALFSKVFGDKNAPSFDPKSRVDIAKKQELEAFLKDKPELAGKSDTQIALQYYRQMENAKRK